MDIIYFFYITVFYFGAILGSFLNVVVNEIKVNIFKERRKKSLIQRLNRRSICNSCKKKLKAFELFPIFSYIFLLGRCSSCKKKFSINYLFAELFSVFLFLLLFYFLTEKYMSFLNYHLYIEFIFFIPVLSFLFIIFFFDLKHKIIPDLILYPMLLFSIFYVFFDFYSLSFVFENTLQVFLNAFFIALPFFLIYFFSNGKAMGFADWKLIFVLSLFFKNFYNNLMFAFGSFLIGAVVSIFLLSLSKKYKINSQIAFGPFIVLSFVLVFFLKISYFDFASFLTFI